MSSAGAGAVIEKPAGPNVEEVRQVMNAHNAIFVLGVKLGPLVCTPRAREEAPATSEIEEPAGPDHEEVAKAVSCTLWTTAPLHATDAHTLAGRATVIGLIHKVIEWRMYGLPRAGY